MKQKLLAIGVTRLLSSDIVRADGLIFGYVGDVLAGDPSSCFVIFNACAVDGSHRPEDGRVRISQLMAESTCGVRSPAERHAHPRWVHSETGCARERKQVGGHGTGGRAPHSCPDYHTHEETETPTRGTG